MKKKRDAHGGIKASVRDGKAPRDPTSAVLFTVAEHDCPVRSVSERRRRKEGGNILRRSP
jgi:hypothetical protein